MTSVTDKIVNFDDHISGRADSFLRKTTLPLPRGGGDLALVVDAVDEIEKSEEK